MLQKLKVYAILKLPAGWNGILLLAGILRQFKLLLILIYPLY